MRLSQKGSYQILRSPGCQEKQLDSTSRKRRVTKDCKAREGPEQFYVLSKAKPGGARLEQSKRKETYQEVFRQERRRVIEMTKKVERWGTIFGLTKIQSSSFHHESTQTD